MKLSILSGALCASLLACCEVAPVEDAPLTSEAKEQFGLQKASFKAEKPHEDLEETASAPKTTGPRDSSNPMTRIVERTGIDPNRGSLHAGTYQYRPVSFTTKSLVSAGIGRPAHDFELKDLTGRLHKLSRYEGKTIILEWFNPDCPFVAFAHESGPLKVMPEKWKAEDVVWIAINSGASDTQGADPIKNLKSAKNWEMRYPLLLDPAGEVGELYKAVTTPQIFVIDRDFILRYAGALDNAPMGKRQGEYRNYVEEAIEAVSKGLPCPKGDKAYGSGVKYLD